jgi:hypothetical protein
MVPLSNLVFENAIKSAELSEGTKTSYLKQLRMALKYFGDSYSFILKHPFAVKKKLEDLVTKGTLSFNSAKSLVIVLISLFKHARNAKQLTMTKEAEELYVEWTQILNEYNLKSDLISEKNQFSEKELEGFVEFEEWKAKEKDLRSSEIGSLRHLLVAFHTLITPLRGGDLAVVRIVAPTSPMVKKSTDNILVWAGEDKPSTLIIRDHKTRNKYPALKRDIPLVLRQAIALSLKDEPRLYLFVDSRGLKWNRNSFMTWKSNTLKEIFNKPVTTNLARHAYVNATRSSADSLQDERTRADEMGHSLDMHQKYRRIQK